MLQYSAPEDPTVVAQITSTWSSLHHGRKSFQCIGREAECRGGPGLRRQCLVNSVARKAYDAIRGPFSNRLTAVDRQHHTALKVLLLPMASVIWPPEGLRRMAGAESEPDSTNWVLPRDSAALDSANAFMTDVDKAEPLLEAPGG
ncbi:hypothetical protein MRX96_017289 [Rhipicephalus microplus]